MKDLIVGIDAGTSVIKSIAFSLDGKQLYSAAVKNEYQLLAGGGAEQDIALTWTHTARTLRELGAQIEHFSERVAAVAVTGQGDGTWMIDAAGKPVGKALLWLDARAADIAAELAAQPADQARFEITGTGLAGCQQGPQLRWLQQHHPDWIASATTSFHCKDWLYFQLTGVRATDPSEGVFSFGDYRSREYNHDVLAALELESLKSFLPPMVEGTRQSHALSAAAAESTGLSAGTPVVLGYVDVICTALGAGIYNPDTQPGITIVGSTGMHMKVKHGAETVEMNTDHTGYTMCMPIPGVYAQMQSNMAATLNIDWLLDMAAGLCERLGVSKSREDLLAVLDSWVSEAEPGAVLYLPFISEAGERGPFIDANARAGFVGLSTRHNFEHLARAIFEGLCFAARDCYTTMGDLPGEVVLSGGAARSKQLLGILSATLEAPLFTCEREEAGAAGAAMIAAVSIGHYSTMDDCVAQWVTPLLRKAIDPDPLLVERYRSLFPIYRETCTALQPTWQQQAHWRESVHRSSS